MGDGGGVAWGCKVTPHQGTIFTMRLFNTQPIYSCQIFSQRLPHTVAPSQTQASDGTGGFTLYCAAKGNTPYPQACSCANPASPPSICCPPFTQAHSGHCLPHHSAFHLFFHHLLCICLYLKMKGEKRDLNPVFVMA